MSLEFAAYRWLHWEKKCPVILWERSPREFSSGRPDMLGITRARFLYEVEIKRTVSDFKANENKRHRIFFNKTQNARLLPKKFWFLVPEKIADAVFGITPSDCGLLVLPERSAQIRELIPSPENRESKRASLKECVKMAHLMANQMRDAFLIRSCKSGEWDYDGFNFYGAEYMI